MNRFKEFCASGPHAAWPLTERAACDWVLSLEQGGKLNASTIRHYASALSTHYELTAGTSLGNPMRDNVPRLLDAVERRRAPLEKARRDAAPQQLPLTQDVVAQLESVLKPVGPAAPAASVMRWAAFTLGAALGPRICELMGVAAEAVSFFTGFEQQRPLALAPAGANISSLPAPSHFDVDFGRTKTDVRGVHSTFRCGDARTVAALWHWCNLRRTGAGAFGPELFRLPQHGGERLTQKALLSWAGAGLAAIGRSGEHFSGKSFRRGFASSQAARGLGSAAIAAAGPWATPSMPEVYTSRDAKLQRQLALSRPR